ncbi:MAG: hypothetical protein RL285_1617 [Bacteroidota bacterium]
MKHVEFLADFVGAELKEMGVEVLGIEQLKVLFAKEFHKENECDFAGIGHGMKHAFAAENFAEGNAIESAHELIILPHFEAMGQANSVEFAIRVDDFFGDPGIAGSERRTLSYHSLKVAVDAGLEHAFSVKARQVFGYFESMIEGNQSARCDGVCQ